MTNYEVGQIIYTILEEKQLVLPVQVVEQVVVKNLTGEETNYKVWPIAVDVNLYSEEQGAVSGTYLVLTVIAAILAFVYLKANSISDMTGIFCKYNC